LRLAAPGTNAVCDCKWLYLRYLRLKRHVGVLDEKNLKKGLYKPGRMGEIRAIRAMKSAFLKKSEKK
jgi:hypothetical protein